MKIIVLLLIVISLGGCVQEIIPPPDIPQPEPENQSPVLYTPFIMPTSLLVSGAVEQGEKVTLDVRYQEHGCEDSLEYYGAFDPDGDQLYYRVNVKQQGEDVYEPVWYYESPDSYNVVSNVWIPINKLLVWFPAWMNTDKPPYPFWLPFHVSNPKSCLPAYYVYLTVQVTDGEEIVTWRKKVLLE